MERETSSMMSILDVLFLFVCIAPALGDDATNYWRGRLRLHLAGKKGNLFGVASEAQVPEEGDYLVRLEPASTAAERATMLQTLNENGGQALNIIGGDMFAHGRLKRSEVAQLRRLAMVLYIQTDDRMKITGEEWHRDRIDQAQLPLSGTPFAPYGTGAGVTVYVLCTGLLTSHREFRKPAGGSRASWGFNFIDGNTDCTDVQGHGTHLAAIVAGNSVGVAAGAQVIGVKVLGNDGNGFASTVIKGMEYVLARSGRRIILLASSGPISAALDDEVHKAYSAGVLVVASAGNNGANGCNFSPGRSDYAITIGASDQTDHRVSSSNYGACLNYYAPGKSLHSADASNANGYRYWSGTSQAAAVVGGVAASYLGAWNSLSISRLYDAITRSSTAVSSINDPSGVRNGVSFSRPPFPTTPAAPPGSLCVTPSATVKCNSVTNFGNLQTSPLAPDRVPACGGFYGSTSIWLKFTGYSGTVLVTTCSTQTNYDTHLSVYGGTCAGGLTCVGSNDDATPCVPSTTASKVTFTAVASNTYWFVVRPYNAFSQPSSTWHLSVTVSCGLV